MQISAWATAGLVLAAFAAGAVDAVAGGSGVIAVPALLAAGLPPHLALGTNKAQGVFGTFASTLGYARAGLVDRKLAWITFPLGSAGSLCGAALVLLMPPSVLRPVVLALLVIAAVALGMRPRLLIPRRRESVPLGARAPFIVAGAVALVLGCYDGFFGPGAGTFFILALALLFDLPLQRASADAKPINFASNLAALALFSARGAVLWKIALPMAAAQFAGAFLGAHLAVRGGDRVVRLVMLAVVLAVVAKLGADMLHSAR